MSREREGLGSNREVYAVLAALLASVRLVLRDRFVGLYLYGSLATGDFDPERSDIDFVVVTSSELPAGVVAELQEMHSRLASSGSRWAPRLEGTYLPRYALGRYMPGGPPRPTLNEGRFYLDVQGADWVIHRHILREHEMILAGPSLREWIEPVDAEDLRRAVRALLREWWEPMLLDPVRLGAPEYRRYAVLSMCRALYTLERGAVTSKVGAAKRAASSLGAEWAPLIEQAVAWRPGQPELDKQRTLALVQFTCEGARRQEIRG